VYPINDTDIGLVFHNPAGFATLKGVSRAPWIAEAAPNSPGKALKLLDNNVQPLVTDGDLSFDDYIKVAMAFLNHSTYSRGLYKVRLGHKEDKTARLIDPPVDILAAVFIELSKTQRLCEMACYYLLSVVYSRGWGSEILMPRLENVDFWDDVSALLSGREASLR
jgi:hypothetical protein